MEGNLNTIAIIPARMNSSRFPGKPLAKICGIPMIGHCLYRTRMCKDIKSTYVATCDIEIAEYVKSIGGNVVMTSKSHERASDRAAEAMLKIENEQGQKVDIVVMVQGDEPMITPQMISDSLRPFILQKGVELVNLMAPINSQEEFEDPNEVKVVCDLHDNAIYFSREPIPSQKKGISDVPMYKQVCIIPFLRNFLLKFNQLNETPLEIIESVDMMRVLEHGYKVRMVKTEQITFSVDTKEDLVKVQELMTSDYLLRDYLIQ